VCLSSTGVDFQRQVTWLSPFCVFLKSRAEIVLQTFIIIFVPNRTLFAQRNVLDNWCDSCCNIWHPLAALACLVAISMRGPDVLTSLRFLPSQANAGKVISFFGKICQDQS